MDQHEEFLTLFLAGQDELRAFVRSLASIDQATMTLSKSRDSLTAAQLNVPLPCHDRGSHGGQRWSLPDVRDCRRAAGFQKTIAPFVQQHCINCHGPDRQQGGLRLDTLRADLAAGPDAEKWNEVRFRLLAGEMPAEKEASPNPVVQKRVVDWLSQELKKNSKVTLRQLPALNLPRFGNKVDHFALFPPEPGTTASSPRRIWRIRGEGYFQLVKDLSGGSRQFVQPFSGGPEGGFRDFAALLRVDEPATVQLISRPALARPANLPNAPIPQHPDGRRRPVAPASPVLPGKHRQGLLSPCRT